MSQVSHTNTHTVTQTLSLPRSIRGDYIQFSCHTKWMLIITKQFQSPLQLYLSSIDDAIAAFCVAHNANMRNNLIVPLQWVRWFSPSSTRMCHWTNREKKKLLQIMRPQKPISCIDLRITASERRTYDGLGEFVTMIKPQNNVKIACDEDAASRPCRRQQQQWARCISDQNIYTMFISKVIGPFRLISA